VKSEKKKRLCLPEAAALAALAFICFWPIAVCKASPPIPPPQTPIDTLANLSLEKLLEVEVETVSKHKQLATETAAATTVLTNEDLIRAGVRSLPEALRLVPGINVAQVDASRWAISARGFNGLFADRILILIDGRSVYSPLYGGVFWIDQDLMIEDVRQIEVVRGPGGALWGANASNGIINVITKNSKETKGTILSVGVGSETKLSTAARYGAALSEDTSWRAYTKYQSNDDSSHPNFPNARDAWQQTTSGLRLYSQISPETGITLLGNFGYSRQGLALLAPMSAEPYVEELGQFSHSRIANLLAKSTTKLSEISEIQSQISYTHINKEDLIGIREGSLSVDFQHAYQLAESNLLVWGAGYQRHDDSIEGTNFINFSPRDRDRQSTNWFLSDEIELVPETAVLTLGSKFEYNELTFLEFQPSIRLRYSATKNHTFWTAASRTVRTPNRTEEDISLILNPSVDPQSSQAVFPLLLGNDEIKSQDALVYEFGYRTDAIKKLSLDLALFFSDYNNVNRASEEELALYTFDEETILTLPLRPVNGRQAYGYGGELMATADLLPTWRMTAWYAYLGSEIEGALNQFYASRNTYGLRSSHDLSEQWKFDLSLRYASRIPEIDIAPVTTANAKLSWQASKDLEIALIGQHLVESQRQEFLSEFVRITPAEIQRGIFGSLTLRF